VAHGISEDEVIGKIMLADMPKKAFIGVDEVLQDKKARLYSNYKRAKYF